MCILKSSDGLKFMDMISYPEIQIKQNAFTFITGESGCGKSTYLKLLNATVLPSAGTVQYRGKNIRELDMIEYRRSVLLVPQEIFLFDGTIQENFNQYYTVRKEQPLNEEQMKDSLSICCADFPLTAQCHVLSGGERQRVFLAIFLSFMPPVLLLDEPTSALDERTSRLLLSNIKNFCSTKKITAAAVCHSRELAKHFADYSIELKKGIR